MATATPRTPAAGAEDPGPAASSWRPERRELVVLLAAIVAAIAIRLAYVLATQDHTLAGDEPEYHAEGTLAAAGKFLWGIAPYGEPHATTWKAPGYGAWVGAIYAVLGNDPDRVFAVQAVVLPPLTITLSWALARTLFTPLVGLLTAVVVAVYPNAWQFDVRLFPEGPTTVLTLGLFLLLARGVVDGRRAAAAGALLGVLLLFKPSSVLLLAPIAVVWWGLAGVRRGTLFTVATVAVALLVVAPWSVRNYLLEPDHFVPLSVQSAAAFGTFNDDAANDEDAPWAWRPVPSRDRDLLEEPRTDGELYAELNRRTREYILEHPLSVPQAFFYNGVLRTWDLQSPAAVVDEAPQQGRTRSVAAVGLAMYWPLLALAIAGLALAWRQGRRLLVAAVAALALATSVVYTSDASTRYRAPFEPLIVALAMSTVVALLPRRAPPAPRPR